MSRLCDVLDELRRGNKTPDAYSREIESLVRSLPSQKQNLIIRCNQEISDIHSGQTRGDGAPYVIHPRRVSIIASALCDQEDLAESLLVALLHDVVEDCGVSPDAISARYGEAVSRAVTLLSAPMRPGESRADRKNRKETKARQVEAAGGTTLTVHFADILDNVVSWRNLTPEMSAWEKLPRWLWQVSNWYLPLAERHRPEIAAELENEIRFEDGRGIFAGSWTDA